MKKKFVMLLLCGVMAGSFVACGNKGEINENGTEVVQENEETNKVTYNGKRSGEFDIDFKKQVTKLAEYDSIKLEVSKSYEVTDDAVNAYLTNLLSGYGADTYEEIKDRDVVEKDDIVKVDYTGYLDGEAFEGGAAEDQYLDVAGNCDASRGSGFIEGFTDGLVGAKVGEKTSSVCTFPEDYQAENLAGKETTFEFNVKAICKPITIDNLTDEKVVEIFKNDTLKTVEALEKAIKAQLEQTLYSQTMSAAKDYMLENCEVEVPQDYLDARLGEYINAYTNENCSDTETLEEFLTNNYQVSAEEAKESWKESIEKQIRSEFIFGLIAENEKIKVDDKDFESYVEYLISNGGEMFSDKDEIFEYYGSGNAKEGEAFLKNQYLVNKAVDLVITNSSVDFK